MFRNILSHPITKGLDIDDPNAAWTRLKMIQQKSFLNKIYHEWYASLVEASADPSPGPILELGSGGDFIKRILPEAITSDIFYMPATDAVINSMALPFKRNTLRAILMINVLHHLPNPRVFFTEANRCLKPGGMICMIEPWCTPWSKWIYQRLHEEPFNPQAAEWEFISSGPMSGANGALPWIIFHRDVTKFVSEFPQLVIQEIFPFMPFRYLLSGGISMRSLMPGWTFNAWRWVEGRLQPWMLSLAMFARIIIQRNDNL